MVGNDYRFFELPTFLLMRIDDDFIQGFPVFRIGIVNVLGYYIISGPHVNPIHNPLHSVHVRW